MKYKAIIFDLDGTLLNTIEDIADSFNAVLETLNYQTYDYEAYKYFVGKGIDNLIEQILIAGKLDHAEFDNLKAGYMKEYALRQRNKTRPYPGIMDLFSDLKQIDFSVNVLSNKPHFQTVDVVKYYFDDYPFTQVYGKKPEFRIKPYPESALDLLSKLGLKSEDILYVGDTKTDIETAINAGFDSVGVLWGFRTEKELREAGAKYIVRKPNEIYQIIVGD